jgi:hypothetical protein
MNINLEKARKFLAVTVSKTRYSAREVRDLDFDIDINYVLDLLLKQQGKCALTGWDLEFTRGGTYAYGTNPNGCTMDRINNRRGYVQGNVQLVCWKANKIKGELDNKEFKEFCKLVVDHA